MAFFRAAVPYLGAATPVPVADFCIVAVATVVAGTVVVETRHALSLRIRERVRFVAVAMLYRAAPISKADPATQGLKGRFLVKNGIWGIGKVNIEKISVPVKALLGNF